jgi:hypothetical protein
MRTIFIEPAEHTPRDPCLQPEEIEEFAEGQHGGAGRRQIAGAARG